MKFLIYDIKVLTFIMICIVIYVIFDKKSAKMQIIDFIIMGILIIVSGFRCNFGSDYFNYYIQYNNISNTYYSLWDAFIRTYQSGFSTLSYFIYSITYFQYGIFWAVAIITYPTIIIFMRKYTSKPSVAFAVYMLMGYFVISNNILKQNIAMVILMVGYYMFLSKNKKIGYIILVFIASKFHVTAIVGGVLIYLGTKIEPTYKNLIRCIVLGIIIFILYNYILPIIVTNIPIFEKYSSYLTLQRTENDKFRGLINIVSYIVMYMILTHLLLKNKNKIREIPVVGEIGYHQISFIFLAIMISIISIRNLTMNRVAFYLYQFIVFLIPNLFLIKYDYRSKKIYLTFIVFLLISWFSINNIVGAENRYFNYHTYLKDTPVSYYKK